MSRLHAPKEGLFYWGILALCGMILVGRHGVIGSLNEALKRTTSSTCDIKGEARANQ
jgi:hypothetical protein